jgi:LytS/YehU family sensor histidine kinase
MYRDVESADAMLIRLSDLLRHALDRSTQQRVPLRDEFGFLDRYLALELMRFGDRLSVCREVDEGLLDALVPNLILQPLVENAIKHGLEPLTRAGTITLRARQTQEGFLRLEVEDDGRGLEESPAVPEGIGTGNTRARLAQLYGGRARFHLERAVHGGVLARIEIPLDIASSAQQVSVFEHGSPSSTHRR